MIKYKNTRGENRLYVFSEVILKGIADNGGLFVPARIPKISLKQFNLLKDKSYQERAFFIFNSFRTGFSCKFKEIIKKAYSSNFDHSEIAPLIKLQGRQYVLELWHGPTSAFKDMALQVMPLLFSEALRVKNQKRIKDGQKPLKYLLLAATSGDTGKAALEGYKNLKNIFIIVFYPKKGVSRLQELQMVTQEGNNVGVYGVEGNFDDVQRMVKEVFNDKEFNRELLAKKKMVISSANSINWGRLLPQIVYHINSYLDLLKGKDIKLGDNMDIAVPSGNFGNILAAFYAKKMGLPIRRLICASNANNTLSEFLKTGIYDARTRVLVKTPSPSMDIIIAGNIERLLFEITQSSKKVAAWMEQLKSKKRFKVDKTIKEILSGLFFADWVSNEECLMTIKKTFIKTGYLIDPHTAIAQAVVERYEKKYKGNVPIIICSTAHFAKFPKDVYKALEGLLRSEEDEISRESNELAIIEKIKNMVPGAFVPKSIRELKDKKIIHKGKCKATKEAAENIIINKTLKSFN